MYLQLFLTHNLLEKAKKIHAAISLASLRLLKLNLPMAIARVFSQVRSMSLYFFSFYFWYEEHLHNRPLSTLRQSICPCTSVSLVVWKTNFMRIYIIFFLFWPYFKHNSQTWSLRGLSTTWSRRSSRRSRTRWRTRRWRLKGRGNRAWWWQRFVGRLSGNYEKSKIPINCWKK